MCIKKMHNALGLMKHQEAIARPERFKEIS